MNPKKKKIILITSIIVVLFLTGAIFYWTKVKSANKPVSKPKTTTKTQTKTKTEEAAKPVLAQSPLDGTMVSPDLANRHPLAIMIENHPQARPQTGLIDASIVYETLAEGGITRFMGIFGPKIPAKAGPVRSARSYYVDWAEEYDAFYAHVGGANDALAKIKTDGVKDLNQFAVGAAAYWREKSNVALEHTMYTDPQKLYNYSFNTKKWANTAPVASRQFKDDALAADRPAGGTLSIDFSGSSTYAVKFVYDPKTNTYSRFMAGAAHKDRATGVQIAPKNVVVQYTEQIATNDAKNHLNVVTTGSGKAKFFIDGKMIEGTWSKSSSKSPTLFKDAAGTNIIFDRGQTWIAVVKTTAPVTWTPAS